MTDAHLDLRTLSVALITISALTATVMAVVFRNQQTYRGFAWWMAANVSTAAGFLLLVLRDTLPDILTVTAANILITGAFGLLYEGTRRFVGYSSHAWSTLAILTIETLGVAYFTYIDPSVIDRIVITSLFSGIFALMSAYILSASQEWLASAMCRMTAGSYLVFGVSLIVRAGLTKYLSEQTTFFGQSDWIQSTSFLIFLLFIIFCGFANIVLNGERTQRDLLEAETKLKQLANTDDLTGLYNKRHFDAMVADEIRRSRRYEQPLSMIIFDLDRFKEINDRYGHAGGDKVLKDIAHLCRRRMRTNDILGRLGGEEFGVVLPHTDLAGAKRLAEELRSMIENTVIEFMGDAIHLTSSFGVAPMRRNDTYAKLIRRADGLLYDAKYAGRNIVVSEADKPNMYLVAGVRVGG